MQKVVWITGAGSGIGAALAEEYAQAGYAVALSGRRIERLDVVKERIEKSGGKAISVVCDVVDPKACIAAAAAVVDQLGRMDVCVANAGMGVVGPLLKLSPEQFRLQYEINVFGVVHTAQAALPELRKTKGSLALVASVAAHALMPNGGAYNSSKAAVRSLGLSIWAEERAHGVSVTVINPGFVESEISKTDNDGVYHADRGDVRPQLVMWKTPRAAKVMRKAIEARKIEFTFTGHGKLAVFLGQHFPRLTARISVLTLGASRRMVDNKGDS